MRSFPIIVALISAAPSFAIAQDDAACTTLAVIQNADCTVRRVAVCDNFPEGWQSVAIYGPTGPISLSTFNADGVPQSMGSGPGTPQTRLGDQPDPLELANVFGSGIDTFEYQMERDDGSVTQISGKIRATGETVTIDGRVLQGLLSRQTVGSGSGEAATLDISFFYDADLKLMITDSIRNTTTQEFVQHRSPVDFILPGEAGFEDYAPRFGCEG